MRTVFLALVLVVVGGCAVYGPHRVATTTPYGACCVEYGDGRQPGIAFTTPVGTPVIAASDGVVTQTGENTRFGGYFVRVAHGDHFDSYYTHLSTVRVQKGDAVGRGQMLGLSGADHTGRTYLHFGLCRKGGSCISYPDSIDPQRHWLAGQPGCYDPSARVADPTRITTPLACGDHARQLLAGLK